MQHESTDHYHKEIKNYIDPVQGFLVLKFIILECFSLPLGLLDFLFNLIYFLFFLIVISPIQFFFSTVQHDGVNRCKLLHLEWVSNDRLAKFQKCQQFSVTLKTMLVFTHMCVSCLPLRLHLHQRVLVVEN